MEKTLSDYDKSLDALDKEKERLENVMRLMGEEWAESGAGIGWMGSLDQDQKSHSTTAGLAITSFDVVTNNQPNGSEYLTSPPISDYVQSLINANQQAQTQELDLVNIEDLLPITEIIPPSATTPSSKQTSILKNSFKIQQHPPSKHA
ncbi:hypothetical protein BC943DRAFT_322947 [Umbelopsis sp. AD052]|nr:hypothetical protein BC943DRAFT_322947 [Umbelopsis sp. AD052]